MFGCRLFLLTSSSSLLQLTVFLNSCILIFFYGDIYYMYTFPLLFLFFLLHCRFESLSYHPGGKRFEFFSLSHFSLSQQFLKKAHAYTPSCVLLTLMLRMIRSSVMFYDVSLCLSALLYLFPSLPSPAILPPSSLPPFLPWDAAPWRWRARREQSKMVFCVLSSSLTTPKLEEWSGGRREMEESAKTM